MDKGNKIMNNPSFDANATSSSELIVEEANYDKWNKDAFSIGKLPEKLTIPFPSFPSIQSLYKIKGLFSFMKKVYFLYGNSDYEKSHALLFLSHKTKKRSKEFAVVNIHNSESYVRNDPWFLFQELFCWFYPEIQESAWLKILLNELIERFTENNLSMKMVTFAFGQCIQIAKRKKKKLLYIYDNIHYNNLKNDFILKNFLNEFDHVFLSINPNKHELIENYLESNPKSAFELLEFNSFIPQTEVERKKILNLFFPQLIPKIEEFLLEKTESETTILMELS